MKLMASPEYIKNNGKLASSKEFRNHSCIIVTVPSYGERWPLDGKSTTRNYIGTKVLEVNNGEIARDMAIAGLDITFLSDFNVEDALQYGQLVLLLDNHVHRESGM